MQLNAQAIRKNINFLKLNIKSNLEEKIQRQITSGTTLVKKIAYQVENKSAIKRLLDQESIAKILKIVTIFSSLETTPRKYKPRSSHGQLNNDLIVKCIQNLNQQGFALNSTDMVSNSKEIKRLMRKEFGILASGQNIVKMARVFFGSWDEALKAAGFSPHLIRKKFHSKVSILPIVSSQRELCVIDGKAKFVNYLGDPPKQADDLIQQRQMTAKIEQTISSLPNHERLLAEKIFDKIVQIDSFNDQDDLIDQLHEQFLGKINKAEIKAVLSALALKLDGLKR